MLAPDWTRRGPESERGGEAEVAVLEGRRDGGGGRGRPGGGEDAVPHPAGVGNGGDQGAGGGGRAGGDHRPHLAVGGGRQFGDGPVEAEAAGGEHGDLAAGLRDVL